jgi:hypothetical protein
MERGIALAQTGTPEALWEALRDFDAAIELRRKLPLAQNPWFRYGLAAGWINRGEALTRLGGAENLAEAVSACTAATELLADLPADDDGRFLRRRAIAWINRGLALEAQSSAPARTEAVGSYKTAIELLDSPERPCAEKLHVLLAGAWINLGHALLPADQGVSAEQSCAAAERALSLLARQEAKALLAAEAGLKARHILCQAHAATLDGPPLDPSAKVDLVCKLTDTAEDALKLVQSWEAAGVTDFRPLALRFFHLAMLVYERHQPQFLGEYLLDHLDPGRGTRLPPAGESWLALAEASLSRACREIRNGDFGLLASPQGLRRLEILQELRAVEARLQTLHRST